MYFRNEYTEECVEDILTASDIDRIMNVLVELFWKDMGSVRGFLKGAMIALDKAQEYRLQELENREQFKEELGAALTTGMRARGVKIEEPIKPEQVSFLS